MDFNTQYGSAVFTPVFMVFHTPTPERSFHARLYVFFPHPFPERSFHECLYSFSSQYQEHTLDACLYGFYRQYRNQFSRLSLCFSHPIPERSFQQCLVFHPITGAHFSLLSLRLIFPIPGELFRPFSSQHRSVSDDCLYVFSS